LKCHRSFALAYAAAGVWNNVSIDLVVLLWVFRRWRLSINGCVDALEEVSTSANGVPPVADMGITDGVVRVRDVATVKTVFVEDVSVNYGLQLQPTISAIICRKSCESASIAASVAVETG
jgi:hypothetical protein